MWVSMVALNGNTIMEHRSRACHDIRCLVSHWFMPAINMIICIKITYNNQQVSRSCQAILTSNSLNNHKLEPLCLNNECSTNSTHFVKITPCNGTLLNSQQTDTNPLQSSCTFWGLTSYVVYHDIAVCYDHHSIPSLYTDLLFSWQLNCWLQ